MFTQEQALQSHEMLFKKALELSKRKRHDYCAMADPFQNYKESAFWDIAPWKYAGARLMEKLSRLRELTANNGAATVNDESMMDTVLDMANLSVICYQLWCEEHHKEKELLERLGCKSIS